jgi:hypothetical protein
MRNADPKANVMAKQATISVATITARYFRGFPLMPVRRFPGQLLKMISQIVTGAA